MPPRRKPLPNPLPEGYTLTDAEKKQWKLGKIIGTGGFGLIYLASWRLDAPVPNDSDFVIKVEYHENGPLFSELKFYQRAAKPESIERWKKTRGLDFLGIPCYFGSGLAEWNGTRYRFMVMDRLGTDLQRFCDENGGRLKRLTVLRLGCLLLDVLEYIHDNEYVHADIKAANVLLDHKDPSKVFLVDYGLSYRYCPDRVHKEYRENPKKGHNGTIEYTSADAHNGVAPSRRGDLEVLGYCLLHWLCGKLPWDSLLKRPPMVQESKAKLMANLPDSVMELSPPGTCTGEVAQFLLHVKSLGYKERPDYQVLRDILAEGKPKGARKDGPLDLCRPRQEDRQPSPSYKPAKSKPAARAAPRQRSPPQEDSGTGNPVAKSKPVARAAPRPWSPPQEDSGTGKPVANLKPAVRATPRSRAPPREDSGTGNPVAKSKPVARAAPRSRAPPREDFGTDSGEELQDRAPTRQRRPRTQARQSLLEEEEERPGPSGGVRKVPVSMDSGSEESGDELGPEAVARPPHPYPLRDTAARRQGAPWGLKQWGGALAVILFLALLLVFRPHSGRRAVL